MENEFNGNEFNCNEFNGNEFNSNKSNSDRFSRHKFDINTPIEEWSHEIKCVIWVAGALNDLVKLHIWTDSVYDNTSKITDDGKNSYALVDELVQSGLWQPDNQSILLSLIALFHRTIEEDSDDLISLGIFLQEMRDNKDQFLQLLAYYCLEYSQIEAALTIGKNVYEKYCNKRSKI